MLIYANHNNMLIRGINNSYFLKTEVYKLKTKQNRPHLEANNCNETSRDTRNFIKQDNIVSNINQFKIYPVKTKN